MSTFPLDNLTKVSTDSFFGGIFRLWEELVVLKGLRFHVSPVRTYVVVGSLVVAASLVTGVKLVVGASSSSSLSGLVMVNGTFVDTPPGYQYL